MYYKVVLSDGTDKQGRLDAKGQAYFPDVPAGPVKVYYGLTQKDADKAGQTVLQNEHQQKVAAFINMLDGMIAKVKGRAAKQKAELQKHGTFGKGWMYTESFLKGVASGTWGLVTGTVQAAKDTIVATSDAECAISNTLMAAIKAGNVGPIKAKYNELKTDIKADAAAIKKLARLLTDPQVKAALESFPKRYFEADSGLDEINMLGKLAPMLVLAVVTLGGGAAVEGSAAAATIAEDIGGEAGTIERLAVATEDAGDVNKVDNVVNTVKDGREPTGFSGRKGFEIKNPTYQPVRNKPEVIEGQPFSGHALDQMQNRGIPLTVVKNAIKYGDTLPGNTAVSIVYVDYENGFRVVKSLETGNIITIIWGV